MMPDGNSWVFLFDQLANVTGTLRYKKDNKYICISIRQIDIILS